MKLIILSDTHGCIQDIKIPSGDVLIHCGDFSNNGSYKELVGQLNIFAEQQHLWKLWIPGNHDLFLGRKDSYLLSDLYDQYAQRGMFYLCDNGIEIESINFYGTPWSNPYFNWAFMLSEEEQEKKFTMIPFDTDVLISHTPPYGILDRNREGIHCGSKALLRRIEEVRPGISCFGHLHDARGENSHSIKGTTFINASNINGWVIHPPVEIEI